ncbi:MAG: 3-hydroxyacyl-CoA dehydrogenase family protein [Candidatus Eisenbacteria bacterium]|nr:3-hydroxyacyl-CoA dehydrogenase family protein [Candidatus Eisenbacteria bacterium]
MKLDERLENVAVLGAAGKMGSGIALLLATEMAMRKLEPEHAKRPYCLHLVDVSEEALSGLLGYLRDQLTKSAEKSIVALRAAYAGREDLVENYDVIAAFVDGAMSIARPSSKLESVAGSRLIFEAIIESKGIKIDVFRKLDALCPGAYYLTNTSSIPITVLDEGANLGGRIIGYHFYNPPAVQKLLELISSKRTLPAVVELGTELAGRLRKKVFLANDIAGFIGNGHFMRDILHATGEVRRLSGELGETGAVYAMNRISQDFLVRPMGIFQLIDYVGVDVCRFIMQVMTEHTPGVALKDDLLDRMAAAGVLGGQYADGSQKDGIVKYEKGRPAGIYDLSKRGYRLFSDGDWTSKADAKLGPLPAGHAPWRALLADPKKGEKLASYFAALASLNTEGGRLAGAYLRRSMEIGEKLVADGVANSADDVNGVMTNGFYHLYGPINEYAASMVGGAGGVR